MPICPECQAEYQAGVTVCADCRVPLTDHLTSSETDDDRADVYVCYQAQQAERLVALLGDKGIEVLVRDSQSTAFPTSVGTAAHTILAVPQQQAALARSVIQVAITDGVVPSDGHFADG